MCTVTHVARKSVELADVFRMHGEAYVQENRLTKAQYQVLNALKNCRTEALGGHVLQCERCHTLHYTYHSCRNRHCPKCESLKAAQWLEARQAELLPVRYFHVVFTLPHEFNNLILYNKRVLYNLLFGSAWETLKRLGADPKRLNGEMGMLSILHTWGQNLSQHNHVHCIVPGGALQSNGQWKPAKNYLFPVKVLSKLFRGIFVSRLRNAHQNQRLKLPNRLTDNFSEKHFEQLLNLVMKKNWVVYAKPPFTSPKLLLSYLGRYTHKMAISNYRILACDEQSVTFKWRDYADDNKVKIMRLKPKEFIRRFLSHVVPKGFMRIRSFGFLAHACKAKKIQAIQKQLNFHPPQPSEKKDVASRMLELTGQDITICPVCEQGNLRRIRRIAPTVRKTIFDTS
jgi:Putative transposase/Transposase zinc-binding domain